MFRFKTLVRSSGIARASFPAARPGVAVTSGSMDLMRRLSERGRVGRQPTAVECRVHTGLHVDRYKPPIVGGAVSLAVREIVPCTIRGAGHAAGQGYSLPRQSCQWPPSLGIGSAPPINQPGAACTDGATERFQITGFISYPSRSRALSTPHASGRHSGVRAWADTQHRIRFMRLCQEQFRNTMLVG